MARLLIASQPIAGHVTPLIPVVRELLARGHEVRWYTGRKYAPQVQAVGAVWEPWIHARDYDDSDFGASFAGRDRLHGLRQLQFDIRHIFVGQLEAQLLDLRTTQRAWPADAVLADQTMVAALLHEELGGPPCALLGVLPLGIQSRDTAPFGLGLLPDASALGRWRNQALYRLTGQTIFAAVNRDLQGICQRLGLPPRPFTPPSAPSLMLQPTVADFEYPQSDLPPQLHFIGPLLPPPSPQASLPDWWPDVLAARCPVVAVTQGTLATDPSQLIGPTLAALSGEDVLVVAAGVGEAALPGQLPANARAAAFIPFSLLLPHVSVYVTNGGYGGVQQALAHGVPCVVAGTTEDKAEVAQRVKYAGVGLNLGTSRPTPRQVRRAVHTLLGADSFRQRAARLGRQLRQHDAPREAAALLEKLVAQKSTEKSMAEKVTGTWPPAQGTDREKGAND